MASPPVWNELPDSLRIKIDRLAKISYRHSTTAGAPPQTPLGSSQCSPDPLAAFKGPTSKGRREREGGGEGEMREGERGTGEGREGRGREGRGKEGRGGEMEW